MAFASRGVTKLPAKTSVVINLVTLHTPGKAPNVSAMTFHGVTDAHIFTAAGFDFLSYDLPAVGPSKVTQPMTQTSAVSSYQRCGLSNILQHCSNQAGATQSNQISTSVTKGFAATTTIGLTVRPISRQNCIA